MGRIALVVEYDVKAEHMQAFSALIREHARATLAEDPGCVSFEVLMPRDMPGKLFLYECYADEAAFAAHNASARLAETREKYKDMLSARRIAVCDA